MDIVATLFPDFQTDIVMHFAIESDVDSSIDGTSEFIRVNIVVISVLLDTARNYWLDLSQNKKAAFRFHHISSDEVHQSLDDTGLFMEEASYDPTFPDSVSKASFEHFVRAWYPLAACRC